MPIAYALVTVKETEFLVQPLMPAVIGGLEPLQIGANWDENDYWDEIHVGNFRLEDGTKVASDPEWLHFEGGTNVYKPVTFEPTTSEFFCKYDVVYVKNGGKNFTFDPTIMIKPPGFSTPSTRK